MLHGQGYSIMELKEIAENQNQWPWNYFYFDIRVNWLIKTGKIQSDDVFKSYKKLIEDLGYDVVYIYTNEWMNEEQKKVITAKVRDSYRMYKASMGQDIDNEQKKETQDEMEMHEISPQMLKEVERYGIIIDSTIEKIQNLILKHHATISSEKKAWLENIEHSLLQVKWSSNLWKIKTIVEDALKNVWEIELNLVKDGMNDDKKKFLEETNSLLKQIGSSNRINTWSESVDVGKAITGFLSKFSQPKQEEKKETKKVDTNSFIYYKNQRELNLYKENLNSTDLQILKAVFTLQFSKIKRLRLKKKLLLQNIQIIDNRIHNRNISYTKIVHGFEYYREVFFSWIEWISKILSYAFFLYIVTYFTLDIGVYFWVVDFSFQSNKIPLYLALLSILAVIFSFTRNFLRFFIILPIIYVLFYFFNLNF